MKVRILQCKSQFRFQKRILGFWFNIGFDGKAYHPEQLVHEGHITVDTKVKALEIKRQLENPIPKPEGTWKVVDPKSLELMSEVEFKHQDFQESETSTYENSNSLRLAIINFHDNLNKLKSDKDKLDLWVKFYDYTYDRFVGISREEIALTISRLKSRGEI